MGISSVSGGGDTQYQANERRDITRRLTAAEQSVAQAEKDSRFIVDNIRENADREVAAESFRKGAEVENLKNKGYEQIRELRRAQDAELNRSKRDGEMKALKLEEYYRDANINSERRGREQLSELQHQNLRRSEFERRSAAAEEEKTQKDREFELTRLREHTDEQIKQLDERYQKQVGDYAKDVDLAKGRAEGHFDEQFKGTLEKTTAILADINQRARDQIKSVRENTEQKLNAYSSRERDPFYRLTTLRSRLFEDRDKYTLVAKIPKYEQEHIQASLTGNNLVLNGYRRNDEELNEKDGHSQQSSSFQSFHETYPLETPADGKRLKQYFQGDNLIVEVPKLKFAYKRLDPVLNKEDAHIELPHFPRSIEYAHDQEKLASHDDRNFRPPSDDEIEEIKKTQGTLT